MNFPGKLGVFGNVVLELVKNLPENKNFKLYFHNWLSSVDLVCLLKQQSISSVATIRSNRLKVCALLSDKKLKQNGCGSIIDHRCEENKRISVVKWYDSKSVYLQSISEKKDRCREAPYCERI